MQELEYDDPIQPMIIDLFFKKNIEKLDLSLYSKHSIDQELEEEDLWEGIECLEEVFFEIESYIQLLD